MGRGLSFSADIGDGLAAIRNVTHLDEP
jgi:hypothetical protein